MGWADAERQRRFRQSLIRKVRQNDRASTEKNSGQHYQNSEDREEKAEGISLPLFYVGCNQGAAGRAPQRMRIADLVFQNSTAIRTRRSGLAHATAP
jgi:hypothetical protein